VWINPHRRGGIRDLYLLSGKTTEPAASVERLGSSSVFHAG
jgi:hypothetical protein